MTDRPFRVLGIQQIAIGGLDKTALSRLWVDTLGLEQVGSFQSERENVDEDILVMGRGAFKVEVDLMQPIDPDKKPRVHQPPLNHIGLWIDDLAAAVDWLEASGVRFTPGGIRNGAAGHDVCFIHPKGSEQSPIGGGGVLIELVQAPADVVAALGVSATRDGSGAIVSAPDPAAPPGSGAMFDAIAARYDRLNRILSLGLDRRWRRRAVEAVDPRPGQRVLDLATGTADLALALARREGVTVVGIDPSEKMLAIGRDKIARAGASERVRLDVGDAEELPLPDHAVDHATIAFGIRNVPDRGLGLREMARVVRPGGRVVVLELSEPRGRVLGRLARWYLRALVPRIGGLLSGVREYRYLQESVAAFPPPDEFASAMAGAGLVDVTWRSMTFGVVALFAGSVPG